MLKYMLMLALLSPLSSLAKESAVKEITMSPTSGLVFVEGVISGSSSPAIVNGLLAVQKAGAKEIWIFINSPGGSVFDGARIISQMERLKRAGITVNTVCTGLCASMAAHIHQYGSNRYMTEFSILMFHPASGGAEGEVDKMSSRLSFITSFVKRLDSNVAERSKMELEKYKQLQQNEKWADDKESKSLNFSDGTVSTDIPVVSAARFSLFGDVFGILFRDLK